MNNLPKEPIAMEFTTQTTSDFSVIEDVGNNNYTLWQFSLQYKVVFQWWCYVPHGNTNWTLSTKLGFQEMSKGLCYWDIHCQQWNLFSKEIQEAYTSFIAEKEILNE